MSRGKAAFSAFCLALVLFINGCSSPVASAPLAPTETATILPTGTPLPASTPTITPTSTATPTGEVTLAAVGDLMLGRSVGDLILEKGPQAVFAQVQAELDKADLRVGNLECAVTDTGTPEPRKTYTLKAPPQAAEALAAGKFDLVSLANNHAMDYGFAGLQRAQALLSAQGIASVGAGADFRAAHSPVILERNGLHIAFLGYVDVPEERDGFDARDWVATQNTPGLAWADPAQIAGDVKAAKTQADLVVVLLHSGNEIGEFMSVITTGQMDEAHAAIDAGAAVVIGSHPHELQTIEMYHGGLIAYSLGNFIFDDYKGIANASVILRVQLTRQGVQGYDYVPVLIDNGLPHVIPLDQVPAIGTLVAP